MAWMRNGIARDRRVSLTLAITVAAATLVGTPAGFAAARETTRTATAAPSAATTAPSLPPGMDPLTALAPARPPSVPGGVTVTPLVGGVKVSWELVEAPKSSPVTSYIVRADLPGLEHQVPGGTDWTVFTAADLAGVTSFTVAAVNREGTSAFSAAVAVAPAAAPLADTVTFSGHIASWSGFPVGQGLYPSLTFQSDRGGAAVNGAVGQDGTFALDIPPGPGTLTYYDYTFRVSAVVNIPDGGLQQDLKLPDQVTLPVKVVDAEGLPIEGAYVSSGGPDIFGRSLSVPFEFFPGAVVQGSFDAGAAPTDAQGRTTLLMRQAGDENYVSTDSLDVPMRGADFGSQPCGEVCPAPELTVATTGDSMITGKLRTAAGAAVPGIRLQLVIIAADGSVHWPSTLTEDDGSYAIAAPNGPGWISVTSAYDGSGPGFNAYGEFSVDGDRTVNLTIPNPVTLRTTLRDANGPVAGGCVSLDEPDSPEKAGLADLVPFQLAPGTTVNGIAYSPVAYTEANGVAEVQTLPVARLGTLVSTFPDGDSCTGPSFRKAPFNASAAGSVISKTIDLSQKRPLAASVALPSSEDSRYVMITDSQGDVSSSYSDDTVYVAPGVASFDVQASVSGLFNLRYAFNWSKSTSTQLQELSIATPPLTTATTIAAMGTELPFLQRNLVLASDSWDLQECLTQHPVEGDFEPVPGVTTSACYDGWGYTGESGQATAPMAAASLGQINVLGDRNSADSEEVAATQSDVVTVPPATDIQIPIVRAVSPSDVTAAPAATSGGSASLAVSWSPPASLGSAELIRHEVAATPSSGQGATVLLPVEGATNAVLEGLTPWTDYRISVSAVTGAGPSLPALDETSTDPASFAPLEPVRAADTRNGTGGVPTGPVGAGDVLQVQVAGVLGVPADASAVSLNVTAVYPAGYGFVTVYPCGQTRPTASTLNFSAGTIANAAIAQPGAGGEVCLFTSQSTQLIVDVNGYFPAGSGYGPLVPVRAADTRNGTGGVPTGPVGAGQELQVQVAGTLGVPADASAVSLNVTAVYPAGYGFVTVYPCGQTRPTASTLNFSAGTIANAAIAKPGTGGKVCLYVSQATQLIVDINGYFPIWSDYAPLVPVRAADTRNGTGGVPTGPVGAGQTLEVAVAGAVGVPADATAVSVNVTAVYASGYGFVTVFPCGQPRPTASTLNFSAGTIANAAIAKPGTGGKICLFTSEATQLIVDVNGYFAPAPPPRAGLLRVVGWGPESVGLEWTNPAAANLASVILRRAEGGVPPATPTSGAAVALATPTAQSAIDSGLAEHTTYAYSLFTKGTDGRINPVPSTVIVTTLDVTAPAQVTNLRVTQVSSNSISMAWNNPADPDFYRLIIRRQEGPTPPATITDGTQVGFWPDTAVSLTDTWLASKRQYSYSVFTLDQFGNASQPVSVTATTL